MTDKKEIPGFPGYYCDRDGNVYSDHPGGRGQRRHGGPLRRLTPYRKQTDYLGLSLIGPSGRSKQHVHRLILLAWVGEPIGDRNCCNHRNGDKSDNRLENLEWCSHSENMLHCTRILGKKNGRGENAHFTKLDPEKVRAIRRMREETGLAYKKIGEHFGVHETVAMRVAKREAWGHIE